GVYEPHDWIPPLEDLIRAIHAKKQPLAGICFGHQIIAQALGGKVVKFDGGWSVGAQTYQFEDGPVTLNAWHQDQVVALPDGAQVLASSDFCANAAVAYGDRIYTVQAHPEFTATEVDGLIRKRGPGVVPDALLANAADNLNAPLGSSTIAKRFAATFRGEK
ncbi:MAG: type 1 glutamine amidotransferase, partial [Pseudooceanicola atlanticus]